MYYMAEIDSSNVVLRIVCVDDPACFDASGKFDEELAEQFLVSIGLDGRWLQTADDVRVRYAKIGMLYDEQFNCFVDPPACDNAVFDEIKFEWLCPEDWDIEFLEDVLSDDTLL